MKVIEEPGRLIVEEKGDTFKLGCGAILITFITLLTLGIVTGNSDSNTMVGLILVFSPALIMALFFLRKPYKHRYVFDNIKRRYLIETVNIFGVKRATGELHRIKLVQVSTWEESSDTVSDWSVYGVKLVFDEDPSSSEKLKQVRFQSENLEPDDPMKVAVAISSFLNLPQPRIEKIHPAEEFFNEADNWFDNVAKKIDKRFR